MPEYKRKRYPGVRERGPNKYEINFLVNGQRHYETVYALTALEAHKKRIRRMAELEGAPNKYEVYRKQLPIRRVFEVYRERNEKVLDENTLKRAECVINHLVTFLQARHPQVVCLHQLTVSMCKDFQQYLVELPTKSLSGVNADIDRLRSIFSKLCDYEFVEKNYFREVKKFDRKVAKPKQKYLPTENEVRALLQRTQNDPSYSDITAYLVRTGRRIQETCSLLKSDVNLAADGMPESIKIRAEITKTKEPGRLLLDGGLANIIDRAMKKYPLSPYLFTNIFGRPIASNTYRLFLVDICKAEKINGRVSPHSLRFFAVTRLCNNGVNPKDGMQITGHADLSTYLGYARTTKEGIMSALSKTKVE